MFAYFGRILTSASRFKVYVKVITIALGVIFLAACGAVNPPQVQQVSHAVVTPQSQVAGKNSVPLTGSSQVIQISIAGNAYSPREPIIPAGARVVWTNNDSHDHTVTAGDGSFQSGTLKPGDTFEHTFTTFGAVIYYCEFHGAKNGQGMSGAVVVVDPASQELKVTPDQNQAALATAVPTLAAAVSTVAAPDTAAAQSSELTGVKRIYYIAAVEEEWDYAPANKNLISGEDFDEVANVFVANGPKTIGKVYTKAVYREFTDESFETQKPVAPEWQHLGILGPVIHAEVGDQIIIYFKNNTSIPVSMHPHGVKYKKDSEGAGYSDQTAGTDKADDAVAPGGTHTYVWDVPNRAGPGPMEPSSVMWMYHSHIDEPGDTNAGLMGPMIITARGKAKPDGSPRDVDREVVAMFSVMDENASPFLQHNIDTKTGSPGEVVPDDEEFGESNLMHSINGYVYGNLPGIDLKVGERVRWYVMGMGTEVDLHTPHWHGNIVTVMGMHMDVVSLLPASMLVADMVPDNPGVWLFHCHVNDHIVAGMQAVYTVKE